MSMLGKYFKTAGMLLVLTLSFCPQVVQGEEVLAPAKDFADAIRLQTDTAGRSGITVVEDPNRDISLAEPGATLKMLIPTSTSAGSKDGFIFAEDLVQKVGGPTTGEAGHSFLFEELVTFCSGPAWYLVGRLRNTDQYGAELTLITWEVGGQEGEVLATAGGYIRFLNPNESKPFKLMVPLSADVTWCRVQVTPGFKAQPCSAEFQGAAETYKDRGAAYVSLLGQVINLGSKRQDFVKVIVEFLDESGQLLDVDWAFLNYLDPGQSQSFTVYTPHLQTRQWRIYFD